MLKRRWRWSVRLLGGAVGLGLAGLLVLLSRAQVETTASGAHTRLLLPVLGKAIAIPVYAGTGDAPFMAGHLDGPVVRRSSADPQAWDATWFCQDRVHHRSGRQAVLRIDCADQHTALALAPVALPPAIGPMPTHVTVLSDLEGNRVFLDAALRELGIVDTHGVWRYGTGQLVILGDAVDRGREAFAVLWRLRTLSTQAQAAGGAVHLVLGNHEQYALMGNVSRAHPDHRYALAAMGGANAAYARGTLLGDWLRAQPIALKLGRTLFVHGGVAPQALDNGLDVTQLNAAINTYWTAPRRVPASTASALLGLSGLTRYRGYFQATTPDMPIASDADITRTLTHFEVDRVVVGHTLVEHVQAHHAGRVWAVDVNSPDAASEVLVFENGVPRVVPLSASRLLGQEPPLRRRDFDLGSTADWRLLLSMARAFYALSNIPQIT